MKRSGGKDPVPSVFRVGLTGGIATGKSQVAEVFQEEGALVLDADTLGHELMDPGGPAFAAIRKSFGDEILGADGRIDRRKLGGRVFKDQSARREINAILHPLIMEVAEKRIMEFGRRFPGGIAVLQAALVAESGAAGRFHRIVMTDCDAETQIFRLKEREGIPTEEALRRIRSQADPAERRKIAHLIIDTSGSVEETRAKAKQAFGRLRSDWEALQASEEKSG